MKESVELFAKEVSPLAVFNPIEAGLAALREEGANTVYDCTTTEGDKSAREFRRRCVGIRSSANAAYKDWNQPMLETQRSMRAKLSYIEEEVAKVESPIDALIKSEESRKEKIKAEKARIEAERKASIAKRIASIVNLPISVITAGSDDIQCAINSLDQDEILLDEFQEATGEATQAKNNSLETLRSMLKNKVQQEEEAVAAQLAAAALKAEAEARAKREAEEAKAKAERDEAERKERELAAKKLQEENERVRLEQEAAAKKLRDEAAELDRQKADHAAAIAAHEAQKAAEAKRIADEKAAAELAEQLAQARAAEAKQEIESPTDAEIIEAVASRFSVTTEQATAWILSMDFNAMRHSNGA